MSGEDSVGGATVQAGCDSTNRLSKVRVETTLGSNYVFPDVDPVEMDRFFITLRSSYHSLTLSNVSRSCLVVPLRIVKAVYVDDVKKWPRD